MAALLGVAGLVALLVGWVAVQQAWSRAVADDSDADPLGGRSGCGGCGCATPCEGRKR